MAAILLGATWRASHRLTRLCAAALIAVLGISHFLAARTESSWTSRAALEIDRESQETLHRARALSDRLDDLARQAAGLPAVREALLAPRGSRAPLFRALESLRPSDAGDFAIAIHSRSLAPLAWTGRILELQGFSASVGAREDTYVIEGSVSTTMVSVAHVKGSDGAVIGVATAEVTVASRRNLRNAYLRDFDRIAADSPDIEVQYVDIRDRGIEEHSFGSLPPGISAKTVVAKTARGKEIAAIRVRAPRIQETRVSERTLLRRIASGIGLLGVLAWCLASPSSIARAAAGATLARALLVLLGAPFPAPGSRLLAADVYASGPGAAGMSWLALFLASPLDLFLTVAWLVLLCAWLLRARLARPQKAPSAARALLADLAAVPLLALAFLALFDTISKCHLDLEAVSLVPRSLTFTLLHLSLLGVLACGASLLLVVFDYAGGMPRSKGGIAARLAGWAAILVFALRYWPRDAIGLPLAPALLLFVATARSPRRRQRWSDRLARAEPEALALVALALVTALGGVLYPSLVHFDEKKLRAAIERDARPARAAPARVARATCCARRRRRSTRSALLEDEPQGPHPPDVEELAFAVWSATELASLRLHSAVEIQDDDGFVISRFALNLPSIAPRGGRSRRARTGTDPRERVSVASAETSGAARAASARPTGRVHGADPPLRRRRPLEPPLPAGRDPYSVLFRPPGDAPAATGRWGCSSTTRAARPVQLRRRVRPPSIPELDSRRVHARRRGLWTTLPRRRPRCSTCTCSPTRRLDLRHRLPTPRRGPHPWPTWSRPAGALLLGRGLRPALRAAAAHALRPADASRSAPWRARSASASRCACSSAFVPGGLRAGGRCCRRWWSRFVADRLRRRPRRRPSSARRWRAEGGRGLRALPARRGARATQPVTDAALVWVASLIRNDLDVFERRPPARLEQARAVRLGPAAPRVSGAVFRELVLEERALHACRNERIGGFAYQVVSVPVRLDEPGGRGVLSIPLALRQRERASGGRRPRAHRPAGLGPLPGRRRRARPLDGAPHLGPDPRPDRGHRPRRRRRLSSRASRPRPSDELRRPRGLVQPDGRRPPAAAAATSSAATGWPPGPRWRGRWRTRSRTR